MRLCVLLLSARLLPSVGFTLLAPPPAVTASCSTNAATAVAPLPARRCSDPCLSLAPPGTAVITCGRCKAAYPIDLETFGEGRQVHCSNCHHEWYQAAARVPKLAANAELIEYPQEMKDRLAAGKPAEPISRYRCFVGNLPFAATEDDLRDVFEDYGTIVSVAIMADETGRPKGFGFVNFESAVAGAKAVEELNGYMLHGRAINVSEGKQSASRGDGRGRGRGGRGGGRGRGGGGGGRGRRGPD